MPRNPTLLLAALVATLSSVTATARSQTNHLPEVEKAYANVDYAETRRLAQAALEQGGNDRASTLKLYWLWGTAAAGLDREEEARDAFLHALAADPQLKLDSGLSPKIRAPYLEARGALSGQKQPLSVSLQRRQGGLELALGDSLHLVSSLELWTRSNSEQPYARRHFEAAPRRLLPLPSGSELQFVVKALDSHGNALFELGREEDPARLTLAGTAPRALSTRPAASVNRTPYFITAGALAALGLGAGGVATAMILRREEAAREWNGPGCEQPGATREQQCSGTDERRRHAENLAIGFSAAGGALLLGSVVTLALTPGSSELSVALDLEPGSAALHVRGKL